MKNKIVILIVTVLLLFSVVISTSAETTTVAKPYNTESGNSQTNEVWGKVKSQATTILQKVIFPLLAITSSGLFIGKCIMVANDFKYHGAIHWKPLVVLFVITIFASIMSTELFWKMVGL